MRIIILGGGSFIARAVIETCRDSRIDHVVLRHDQDAADVAQSGDCIINFTFDPRYRSLAYAEEYDCDLRAARTAAARGAHFIMLSTRRVYGPEIRWDVAEIHDVAGDETVYGRNKARSENAVRKICGQQVAIFRLSNIFGYEYNANAPRKSFLGQLLYSLKHQNKIFFDMNARTRRDFLPVEICANLLVARATDATTGIYNLGSGFAVACGTLAQWIMDGFGGGELICDPAIVRDEFYLNMDQWRSRFALPVSEELLKDYCLKLGRRLQCGKS